MKRSLGQKRKIRIPSVWIAVILIYVLSAFFAPVFSLSQIRNIMRVISFLGTVAIGQTFVIITRGLDLSVAGVITTTTVVCCVLMNGEDSNILVAVLVCLAIGVVVGVAKGLLITKLKIVPMITTLAINTIVFGFSLIITDGVQKGRVAPKFEAIGDSMILGVPTTFLVFVIFAAAMWFLANRTRIGKEIYATGANSTAAYVSGINHHRSIIVAHTICSVSAVITGLLLVSYTGLSSFDTGDPYTMNSIASSVIGGTLMTGGVGTVIGTVGGALFMTLLNTITNVLQMSSGVQILIRGLIIIIGISSSSKTVSNFIHSKLSRFKKSNQPQAKIG